MRYTNAGSMLAHRLWRWTDIKISVVRYYDKAYAFRLHREAAPHCSPTWSWTKLLRKIIVKFVNQSSRQSGRPSSCLSIWLLSYNIAQLQYRHYFSLVVYGDILLMIDRISGHTWRLVKCPAYDNVTSGQDNFTSSHLPSHPRAT